MPRAHELSLSETTFLLGNPSIVDYISDLQFNDETKVCRVLKSALLSLTLFQKELATFIEREQAQVLAFAVSCF
jgi:hypothetical protein